MLCRLVASNIRNRIHWKSEYLFEICFMSRIAQVAGFFSIEFRDGRFRFFILNIRIISVF